MSFTMAWLLDLGAAGLTVLLVGAAVGRPARARLLLVAALGAVLLRAGAGFALAGYGWVFAARRVLVDLPLAGLPVTVLLAWSVLGSRAGAAGSGADRPAASGVGRNLGWTASGTAAVAAIDPVLLPGPLTLAALIGSALILPWVNWSSLRPLTVVAGFLIGGLVLVAGLGWWGSRLPGRYDLAEFAAADLGRAASGNGRASDDGRASDNGGTGERGGAHAGMHPGGSITPVTAFTGPAGTPDVRVELTAAPLRVRQDGRTVEAVAFNGTIPGPAIRAALGDLVEVHLCNRGDTDGVSVHWHGYDVPNAEDGVAGVTQEAVQDGECHDYRFHADRAGSYWYHAHQDSSSQVERGLYGALEVAAEASAGAGADAADLTVLDHGWRPPGGYLAGADWQSGERSEQAVVAPGTAVRLRLVNTDRRAHRYRLTGARFRVTAVDGSPITGPTDLDESTSLLLAAGGRYDLSFGMPAGGVRLTGLGDEVTLRLTATGGTGAVAPAALEHPAAAELDLLSYGIPVPGRTLAGAVQGRPDREFSVVMDRKLTFVNGRVGYRWAVNGRSYPQMPMLMVAAGDLVRVRLVNRTTADHPMHLHGHHVLVLSRNGRPATGAPWWSDTLNVAPGEEYVIAFRADNPGIWMDHCHDLKHAADGFVLHLAYTGVSTPFRIGTDTDNRPE